MESSEGALENANVDLSMPKIIGIGAIGVISAFLFGYFLNAYFQDGNTVRLLMLILVSASVFLIVFLLQVFFVKGNTVSNYIILAEGTAVIIPFLFHFSLPILIGWIVLLLGFWNSKRRGKGELDNLIKIKFLRVERHTIPAILTAISLFISLVYLGMSGGFDKEIVSKRYLRLVLKPAEPAVQRMFMESFSIDMTAAKLAEAMVVSKLGVAASLPAAARSVLVNQALNELRAQGANYGIIFKNSDTIVDITYNYIAQFTQKIPKELSFAISAGIAFLIFITIRSIAVFLRWLIIVPAYVVYELALALGFARLTMESRSREIVILK